jgi:hypothetical protein
LKLASNKNLIQYVIGLVKIEYQIQFTYAAKIAVQYLNKMMDDLKDFKLIVISINAHAEIQAGIPPVYDLVTSPLNKVAEFGPSRKNESTELTNDLGPLLLGVRRIPLGEPHFALAADQEHEINHGGWVREVVARSGSWWVLVAGDGPDEEDGTARNEATKEGERWR